MCAISKLVCALLLASTEASFIPHISTRIDRSSNSRTFGIDASRVVPKLPELNASEHYSEAVAKTPVKCNTPYPLAGQSTHFSRRAAVTAVVASLAVVGGLPRDVRAKDLSEEYRQGTAALSDSDETAPVPREAYKKLDSGVIYADLRPGAGEVVKQGSKVNLQWVLRKSNGYFVDSSATHDSLPFIFTVGDGTSIQGLDEAVRGMKEGGVRRVLIPPSLAYVDGLDDGKPGPLPYGYGPRQQMRRVQNIRKDVPGEYVYLEVQATRVR